MFLKKKRKKGFWWAQLGSGCWPRTHLELHHHILTRETSGTLWMAGVVWWAGSLAGRVGSEQTVAWGLLTVPIEASWKRNFSSTIIWKRPKASSCPHWGPWPAPPTQAEVPLSFWSPAHAPPYPGLCGCVILPGRRGRQQKQLSKQGRPLPAGKSGLWQRLSACQAKYQFGDVAGMQFKE